jgi:hypothetical protein
MTKQLTLGADFDGAAYEAELDKVRLTGQLKKIFEIMRDGKWYTLQGIEKLTGFPQASISASIRCFRKKKFGGFIVDRERVTDSGLFKYKLDITGANVEVILEEGKPRKLPKARVATEEEVKKDLMDIFHWFNCDWNEFHKYLHDLEKSDNEV